MIKSNLERFISKYNLGGLTDRVVILSDGITTSVNCAIDSKNVVADISTDRAPLPVGEYYIFDTAQLRGLLSVLGEDITVTFNTNKFDNVTSLVFTDENTKVTCVLADASAIPATPKLKTTPVFETEFLLDSTITTKFLKSKGALSDAKQFAILSDGKAAKIVVNYIEKQNTSRIEIPITLTKNIPFKTIYLSMEHMAAILSANKEATTGTVYVASNLNNGIIKISFVIEGFTTTYYLVGEMPA